jgi:hypothetical protein
MHKSQNATLKLFILFLSSFLIHSHSGYCAENSPNLQLADSLFSQKKYTQAYELYETIYLRERQASPAMLLKMAFVKEGLGDYSQALYYLNMHYLMVYDKKTLKKMESLAEQHALLGYNYDDAEFFLNIYQKFQTQFETLVLSVVLLFFSFLVYKRRKNGKISVGQALSFAIVLSVVLLLNNIAGEQKNAILTNGTAYLMDGPSPGANIVAVVSEGHRVRVVGKEDIWTKIVWEDNDVYVRNQSLRLISVL